MDMWAWRRQVEEGDIDAARRSGTITLYNQKGEAVARWTSSALAQQAQRPHLRRQEQRGGHGRADHHARRLQARAVGARMIASRVHFYAPCGTGRPNGRAFQQGGMRLATALDEIEPMGDPRVRANEAYYGLLVLARVITWLGPYRTITPELVSSLAALDFSYSQQVYGNLNSAGARSAPAFFRCARTSLSRHAGTAPSRIPVHGDQAHRNAVPALSGHS